MKGAPGWPHAATLHASDGARPSQAGRRCPVPLHGALAAFAEVAHAAPRVWAWWATDGGPPCVSGRPPPDAQRTDTAAVLIALLLRAHGDACTPALQALLRQALRRDGSLPSPVLLRMAAPLLHLH